MTQREDMSGWCIAINRCDAVIVFPINEKHIIQWKLQSIDLFMIVFYPFQNMQILQNYDVGSE